MHKAAAQKVNYVIGEAKEVAKIPGRGPDADRRGGSRRAGVRGRSSSIAAHVSEVSGHIAEATKELTEFGLGTMVEKSGAGGGAKGAMGMGTGDQAGSGAGGNAVDDTGSEKELGVLQELRDAARQLHDAPGRPWTPPRSASRSGR